MSDWDEPEGMESQFGPREVSGDGTCAVCGGDVDAAPDGYVVLGRFGVGWGPIEAAADCRARDGEEGEFEEGVVIGVPLCLPNCAAMYLDTKVAECRVEARRHGLEFPRPDESE